MGSAAESRIQSLAHEMLHVFREHKLIRESDAQMGARTLDEAYQVQSQCLAMRVAGGERIVGWKIGCTSRAIQEQFGLSQPIAGRLLKPHIHSNGDALPISAYVDCAVEPEMVFRLGSDLGPEADERMVMRAIAAVTAGIELHNYRFWYGQPTSQELIASNGIHADLVIGAEKPFTPDINLDLEGVGLFVNGTLKASGIGAEIMGGPLRSICWLARHAAKHGQTLRAGELIIPGSAVKLVHVQAGETIEACFTRIGSCVVRMS